MVCTIVDPQCKTYNATNGDCLSCYPGYSLDKARCVIGSAEAVTPIV